MKWIPRQSLTDRVDIEGSPIVRNKSRTSEGAGQFPKQGREGYVNKWGLGDFVDERPETRAGQRSAADLIGGRADEEE